MKYQFCIRFNNIDKNSAASKAVLDCNEIFSRFDYKDYTITVGDNNKKFRYYCLLIKQLFLFYFSIKNRSIVGIQYPLLSINSIFKYFIRIAKIKNIRFFCIVHDLESLRSGGNDQQQINLEIANLNYYDYIIVHNDFMMSWLKQNGVVKPMISLLLFDYLCVNFKIDNTRDKEGRIIYAGNLSKSKFVYQLPQLKTKFNIFGPGFINIETINATNVAWCGEYSPDEIPKHLKGSYGLIWDGAEINKFDDKLGNYLCYNNPHKFSLYIAAGLPVIAPEKSAIGAFIKELKIGFLITKLADIQNMAIDDASYSIMINNILKLREKVINGIFFSDALTLIERNYDKN